MSADVDMQLARFGDAPVVTTVTTPAATTQSGRSSSTPSSTAPGARVNNTSYDSTFDPYRGQGITLRDARSTARDLNKSVPMSDSGGEVCLLWHVLGHCWENCARRSDHRRQRAHEKEALKAWCQACFLATPLDGGSARCHGTPSAQTTDTKSPRGPNITTHRNHFYTPANHNKHYTTAHTLPTNNPRDQHSTSNHPSYPRRQQPGQGHTHHARGCR